MLYFDIPLPVFVFFPSLFLCRSVSVSHWPFCILSSYWSFLFHRATELVEMCRINLLCWKKSIMIHNDCFVYLWQFVTRFVTVGIMWYPGFVSKRLPVWWKKASDWFEFCSMCPGCWSLLLDLLGFAPACFCQFCCLPFVVFIWFFRPTASYYKSSPFVFPPTCFGVLHLGPFCSKTQHICLQYSKISVSYLVQTTMLVEMWGSVVKQNKKHKNELFSSQENHLLWLLVNQ